jgi:aldose 1-epimerase
MMTVKHKSIRQKLWGTIDGKEVVLFRMENDRGAYVEISNYGATLVSAVAPDRDGKMGNVILSYHSLEGYQRDKCYIGSTVGRFANRIGGAAFKLDGVWYSLDKNDGENTNHGGFSGFNSRVFDFSFVDDKLHLMLFSPHGEGGFPGNLKLHVVYSWNNDNELEIQYKATSDQKTIANFTNHAYFDLSADKGKIFDHELSIQGSHILETDQFYIPTGKIIPAAGNAFHHHELREKMSVTGNHITGLNTYFIFDSDYTGPACILSHPRTGRKLEVFTSYPGVQLYTGDFLRSEIVNDRASFHEPFDGLCLECQFYPDSPNHEHFPSTVIGPGEVFNHHIIYRFSTEA